MTEAEKGKGNAIARAIWQEWIPQREAIDLVPWVKNPESPRYDAEKTAEHRGYQKAVADLKAFIAEKAEGV